MDDGVGRHEQARRPALRDAGIADAIGLTGDIGSLEVGKLADLQVLDATPPRIDLRRHHVDQPRDVMKNGRLCEADTLTEIWPRNKPLPEMWWWRTEPDEMVPLL